MTPYETSGSHKEFMSPVPNRPLVPQGGMEQVRSAAAGVGDGNSEITVPGGAEMPYQPTEAPQAQGGEASETRPFAYTPRATARERAPEAASVTDTPGTNSSQDIPQVIERLSGEEYWHKPVSDPSVPSSLAVIKDRARADRIIASVDKRAQDIQQYGFTAYKLPEGTRTAVELPGGSLLRVVRDVKVTGGEGPAFGDANVYIDPEEFNERVRDMGSQVLYRGGVIAAHLEANHERGPVDVARRVGYLQLSPSGQQLMGRSSENLNSAKPAYTTEQFDTIGSVSEYEHNGRLYRERLTRARIITPQAGEHSDDIPLARSTIDLDHARRDPGYREYLNRVADTRDRIMGTAARLKGYEPPRDDERYTGNNVVNLGEARDRRSKEDK